MKIGVVSAAFIGGAAVLLAAGCAGTTHQQSGAALGAVAGGVLGSQVDGPYQGLAIIAGALIGSAIGSAIGTALDDAEREALQRSMARALNKSKGSEAFEWTSPKGNAAAKFNTQNARLVERKTSIVRPPNVEPTPPLELIGEPSVVTASARYHGGPRADAATLGTLKKGDRVVAMGRVMGQPWIAIGRDNQLIGYVPANVVAIQSDAAERTLYVTSPALDEQQQAVAAEGGLEVDQIDASTSCRGIAYSVTKDGAEIENGTMDACKTVSGNWSYQK